MIDLKHQARPGEPFALRYAAGGTSRIDGRAAGVVVPARVVNVGGSFYDGDVVRVKTGGSDDIDCELTDTAREAVFGVVVDPSGLGIAHGSACSVLVVGWAQRIKVTGTVNENDYLIASSTEGSAAGVPDARTPNVFGQADGDAVSGYVSGRVLAQPLYVGVHSQLGDTPGTIRHSDLLRSVAVMNAAGTIKANVNDEDDATYFDYGNTGIGVKANTEYPFATNGARALIGFTFANAEVWEIRATNNADYTTGAVTLDTVSFTATGSYTPDELTFRWPAGTAYQYFSLYRTSGSNTARIFAWELYEATGSYALVTDPTTDDGATLDDALYNVLASVGGVSAVEVIIDGGSAVLSTGVKADVVVPFAGEITKAQLMADQDGDLVVDIWKDVSGNFPPTNADTITGGMEPTLSGDDYYEDDVLYDWDTAIEVGDILRFNVDSCATITRVTIALTILRSGVEGS